LTGFDNTYETDLLESTDINLTYLIFDNLNTNCELTPIVLILYLPIIILVMLVNAKQTGDRKTFDMKLDSLDEKTKRGYGIALRNFEKFYFIKYSDIDPIKNLKAKKRDQVFDELQVWVNCNSKNSLIFQKNMLKKALMETNLLWVRYASS